MTERHAVNRLAEDYRAAKAAERHAADKLKRATLELIESGLSEVEAALVAGVTRTTVRDWRGKPR